MASEPPPERLPASVRSLAAMLRERADAPYDQDILDIARFRLDELRIACWHMAEALPDSLLVLRTMAWCEGRAGNYDYAHTALKRYLALCPQGGHDSHRELLRLEWLRHGTNEASREASAHIALAGADAVTRESYAAQNLFAAGRKVALDDLGGAVAARLAAADANLRATDDPDARAVAAILGRLRGAGRIALVGNGPSVQGRGAGREIEAHDVVVRFNYPRLSGFEADVGRRTDLILIDAAHRATRDERVLWEPEYPTIPALATSVVAVGLATAPPPDLAWDYIDLGYSLAYPRATTGFRAIVLIALALRKPVTLYGFDFFAAGTPGHYFGPAAAALQHEIGYEDWFVRRFLAGVLPDLRIT